MIAIEKGWLLGLFFILMVGIIWAVSSVALQYVFDDLGFSSPFLVTYLSCGLFVLYLPIWNSLNMCGFITSGIRPSKPFVDMKSSLKDIISVIQSESSIEFEMLSNECESDTVVNPLSSFTNSHSFMNSDGHNKILEVGLETEYKANNCDCRLKSHLTHAYIALYITPAWFFANYLYNCSLLETSVTSSTILSNLSGAFTLICSALIGIEYVTLGKVVGLIISFVGVVLIAYQDGSVNHADATDNDGVKATLPGDLLAFFGAIGYGVYATLVKKLIPDEESITMQLILGYIGMWNIILFTPVGLILWVIYPNMTNALTWRVVAILVGNGLINNVLSDYLWGRSVVLTSATVATVGLAITIPCALLSDTILHPGLGSLTLWSVCGASCIVIGFVFVNIYHKSC